MLLIHAENLCKCKFPDPGPAGEKRVRKKHEFHFHPFMCSFIIIANEVNGCKEPVYIALTYS
jgi:hypothetical protein